MATAKTYDADALRAHRQRKQNVTRLRHFVLHLVLIGLLIVMLYPVIWMVLSAFRPEREIFGDVSFIPTNWTLENFVNGWTLEAVEAVYDRPLDVLDCLSVLIDHSQAGYFFPGGTSYGWQEAIDSALTDANTLDRQVRDRMAASHDLRWSCEAAVTQSLGIASVVVGAGFCGAAILSM